LTVDKGRPNCRSGNEVLALGQDPEDLDKFPATNLAKVYSSKSSSSLSILESEAINKAGTEGREGIVTHDGSNLPWLIASLKKTAPDRYKRWIRHVQIVMPEIKSINTVMREDQDDMFLKIKYNEGNGVKQWMVSDGTLRLLLLTIIPYLLNLKGLFLIEEPEIGINPLAIQAIMDSLRSVWDEQVFVTTHSPEVVNCVMKKDLLLFIKNETGETQIISGTEHRGLTNWTLDIGSGVFYGAGIMR
jgi:predicted ATPase